MYGNRALYHFSYIAIKHQDAAKKLGIPKDINIIIIVEVLYNIIIIMHVKICSNYD